MDSGVQSRSSRPTRKRKTITYADDEDNVPFEHPPTPKKAKSAPEIIDLTGDSPRNTPKKKERGKRRADVPTEEKRGRAFRASAPQSYLKIKDRALTQRLTVLSRERTGTDDIPGERINIAGSTGNVYTVSVGLKPSCNCPHAMKGNQCKHIIYIMLRVLKAPEHIAYQLALIAPELREVIKNAPPIPGVETDGKDGTEKEGGDENRKAIEGECPICYDDLGDKEVTVYCKTGCGNNVHRDCMQKWVAMSKGKATCPYCRANWAEDDCCDNKPGNVNMSGLERNEDGYVNVAGQLGLSGVRDYSSYHQPWARRQQGYGGRRRAGYSYDYYDFEDDY